MSDTLDEDGLTLETLTELKSDLVTDFKNIYGSDINVDSDTPDGQLIGIIAQIATDIREIISNIYNSMDPDTASGSTLDQRCAINGIQRKSGTFTIVPITVATTKNAFLIGLDDSSESVDDIPSGIFTIKDDSGNLFYLLASITTEIGSQTLSFRAADIGNVSVTAGTITTIVTVTAGISSVINDSSVTQQGVDEETDANLRVRRQLAIGKTSQGYTDSIATTISELDDVESVIVNENDTDTEDANGIPAHSIWIVVQGGSDDDIAAAIYAKRPAGVGMKGDEEVYIERADTSEVVMYFDRPTDVPLYIKFTLASSSSGTIDTDIIKTDIVNNVLYDIGDSATTDTIITYLKTLSNKYIITECRVSTDNTNWYETITAPSLKDRFTLSTANIEITT
jgi:uncharacterized phage protein gp47/JayE